MQMVKVTEHDAGLGAARALGTALASGRIFVVIRFYSVTPQSPAS
jgi:hypothetical protein